jgi:Na+-transporting NADH:ubiquinone oxidoreductase subunit NqrD
MAIPRALPKSSKILIGGFLLSDLTVVIDCFLKTFQFDDKVEMPEFVVIGTTPVFRGMRKGILIS